MAASSFQRVNTQLTQAVASTKQLDSAAEDYGQAVSNAVDQQSKIRDRLIEQERLQRQLEKLQSATNRRYAANLFGAGTTNEEAIKRTQQAINNNRSGLRALQARQEIYNKAVRDALVLRNQENQKLAEARGLLRRNALLEEDAINRRVRGLTLQSHWTSSGT